MITKEQIDRCEAEFVSETAVATAKAKTIESSLEAYTYHSGRQYDPKRRDRMWEDFQDADYVAERSAFIVHLVQAYKQDKQSIPDHAVCLFKDGDSWCAVFRDFVNLQDSPAEFDADPVKAMQKLLSSQGVKK